MAAFVGSDNRNAGYVCGEDLVERKPDGGQVVIVENLNVNSVCERITGFEEAVSKGAFEVVKRIQTGNDVSGLKQQVAQVLAQNQIVMRSCAEMIRWQNRCGRQLQKPDRKRFMYTVWMVLRHQKKHWWSITGGMMGIGAQSPINLGKKAVKICQCSIETGGGLGI